MEDTLQMCLLVREKVHVVFDQLPFQIKNQLTLEIMLGVDKLGASGVTDKVDTKMRKVFASVIMSAILGVGAGAVKEDNDDDNNKWKNDAVNNNKQLMLEILMQTKF